MSETSLVAAPQVMDPAARAELAAALARIERGRGLVVRLADMLGGAAMLAGRFGLERFGLAAAARRAAAGVAQAALSRAYDVAILGLDRDAGSGGAGRRRMVGRVAVAGSGVLGRLGRAGGVPAGCDVHHAGDHARGGAHRGGRRRGPVQRGGAARLP